MIKNNVKENLFDDEENIYVGLSDLVNLRESAELREADDCAETDENCGLEGCAAMGEDCLADDLDDEWIF